MALTLWNPATIVSRGNIAVGVSPVVTNINIPKLT